MRKERPPDRRPPGAVPLAFSRPEDGESLDDFADRFFDALGIPEDPDDPEAEVNQTKRGRTKPVEVVVPGSLLMLPPAAARALLRIITGRRDPAPPREPDETNEAPP